MITSIADIKHTFYINLESRPDRKEFVENQLNSIGIKKPNRFNAVKMQNGAIGCSVSHLKILEIARDNNWEHILIVEDDILFLNPELFIQQMNGFLGKHDDFDVLLLAGNNIPPYTPIDECCVQVHSCQTTTGYLVKRHYYNKLIANYRDSLNKLMREPHNYSSFAIDKYWFNLQKTDKWYLIIPLSVTQREDYSNIEKRNVNYTSLMLDLNKSYLMQRLQFNH